jgi:hypothetical protein
MNADERTYRFTEIMSAVSMLPDIDMENPETEGAEDWRLPNLTVGLADKKLRDAILCQTFKEDEQFKFKIVANFCNSALTSIKAKVDNDDSPSADDLEAIAISANILWELGQTRALFGMLGMLGHTCEQFELDIPELAKAFIKGNDKIGAFAKRNPYDILNDSLTE